MAVIEAVASIRPEEAGMILVDLTDDDDEDISEAATEAMMMAELFQDLEFADDDPDDFNI